MFFALMDREASTGEYLTTSGTGASCESVRQSELILVGAVNMFNSISHRFVCFVAARVGATVLFLLYWRSRTTTIIDVGNR